MYVKKKKRKKTDVIQTLYTNDLICHRVHLVSKKITIIINVPEKNLYPRVIIRQGWFTKLHFLCN